MMRAYDCPTCEHCATPHPDGDIHSVRILGGAAQSWCSRCIEYGQIGVGIVGADRVTATSNAGLAIELDDEQVKAAVDEALSYLTDPTGPGFYSDTFHCDCAPDCRRVDLVTPHESPAIEVLIDRDYAAKLIEGGLQAE